MEQNQVSQPTSIRLLIAAEIARTISYLHSGLNSAGIEICGVARRPSTLFEELERTHPDVILINEHFGNVDLLATVDEVASIVPDAKVIVLSPNPTTTTISHTARPTISAVIDATTSVEEIVSLIQHVCGRTVEAPQEEEEPIQPVAPRRSKKKEGKAEVFMVFSGKGGVGKSLIATNLAAALSEQSQARVALIDLDLQFGDIGLLIGIASHPHHIDALAQQPELDAEYIDDTLANGPAALKVLLSPTSPELADLVMTSDIRTIIHEMSKMFDYIVIDGSSHLEERLLEAIELSDALIIVTSHNVTSIKNTKITLRLLQSLGVPQEKILLVLNQTAQKVQFNKDAIESSLRYQAVASLPYDPKTVDDSVDNGSPFVLVTQKAEITKAFKVLTDYFLSEDDVPEEGKESSSSSKRRRFAFGK
ncbi:MAG: AAA family ATPase [Candidatus Dormibacteria bacterium]